MDVPLEGKAKSPRDRPRRSSRTQADRSPTDPLAIKWLSLHNAAAIVAALAGEQVDTLPGELHDFPEAMREAGGTRLSVAEQGIRDLSAMLEPGLSALLALHARGADPKPAAVALWKEFTAARNALCKLAPLNTSTRPTH